jgi:predicted membrane channel-forming protein YqfA (hemolysin III family)
MGNSMARSPNPSQLRSGAVADESKEERIDRELIELLNELRVALPGVQVLFAFLLAVPFTQRFAQVTDLQQDTYMVALLCTVAGTVFLIAPATFHRIRFRDRDKERLLFISNYFAIAGMVLLAAAMTASVFLVTDLLFKATTTAVITALVGGLFTVVWFVLPLVREARD